MDPSYRMNLRSSKALSLDPQTLDYSQTCSKSPRQRGRGKVSKMLCCTREKRTTAKPSKEGNKRIGHHLDSKHPTKRAKGDTGAPDKQPDGYDSHTTTPRATRLAAKRWWDPPLNSTDLQSLEYEEDMESMEMPLSVYFSMPSSWHLEEKSEVLKQHKFIERLISSSEQHPPSQKPSLPVQTRSVPSHTLVLGLDETLVHCELVPMEKVEFQFPVHFQDNNYQVYMQLRPHCRTFLESLSQIYEIIVFTSATKDYTDKLVDILDPNRRLIRHCLFRKHCRCVQGSYVRELSVLGRDLAKTVVVDSSHEAYAFQITNGIQVKSWFEDRRDQELLKLLPFLRLLTELSDVRPAINQSQRL
ncbi:CTD small phosphatase-like protein 3 [Callorhinchus milii]|uniref:CTD small phosphatase-like protein 2 n=1 Tax=Callorhinchus milii TaxID=7868 RepID=V9KVX0_CALMI|nr:CTD small phosphatase-like protein 3 [Callorhinchus milii]|eukprot:gi/632961817/ref/XP_007896970.1/ PREDICTED: CTD small phosphatase-like protein 3 isoform X2 [Callorhinchus milii]